ncbi:OmpA/MotB family protein [Thiospirillum jenense]|uniref:OmpA family protein n=1 Tax=Thiospirillum jenense TaxID=1653858 RepID=A0A839HEN7_9GAMM|nr:OmpA family protein [Thiospirillum jenense]MBB1125647.1 OmpA family protein [Thiospirillum jenense]
MSSPRDPIFGAVVSTSQGDEEHWLSISDLMSGLMIIFLFVSIALMRDAMIERDKIKEVAVAYQESQVELYEALMREFRNDLKTWDAVIDRETLAFEFKSPDVLFDVGKISLKPAFCTILDSFFPRYLKVLFSFREAIDEVRIEGHTSSQWNIETPLDEAYFNNMELSQGRTRSVLNYVYYLPAVTDERPWIKANIAAVGFSSSRIIMDTLGQEDQERSRRVSFRVMTNAETQIRKILEN